VPDEIPNLERMTAIFSASRIPIAGRVMILRSCDSRPPMSAQVKSNVFGSEPRCNGLLLHAMLGVPPVFVVVEALMCQSRYPKRIAITALALALVAGVQLTAAAGIDPHRPACVDARCRKIMSFLKANYCGESPYGNGPKDSCQIKSPKGPRPGVDVVADFGCDWSDAKRAMDCKQQGEPPASFRSLLIADCVG
jgi:hypothetical protein